VHNRLDDGPQTQPIHGLVDREEYTDIPCEDDDVARAVGEAGVPTTSGKRDTVTETTSAPPLTATGVMPRPINPAALDLPVTTSVSVTWA
jgi:hypothetical protein